MTSPLTNLTNLQQRTIAAVVGISIVLSAILYSDWSYLVLFCVISILTQLEFYKLLGLDGNQPLTYYGTFCGLFINVLTFLVEKNWVSPKYYILISPLVTVIFFIKLYKKKDLKPFQNIAFTFLGILYVAVPFALLHLLAFHTGVYNYEIILGFLFLLWITDTGAYFAGTYFGKRKLFERISPKKSWEGTVGGTIAAALVAYVLGVYYTSYEPWQWICIGTIIVITGTLGDLVESLFKRSIAIKDSANTIPGHGGFLDRFDSFLLSLPFIAAFIILFA